MVNWYKPESRVQIGSRSIPNSEPWLNILKSQTSPASIFRCTRRELNLSHSWFEHMQVLFRMWTHYPFYSRSISRGGAVRLHSKSPLNPHVWGDVVRRFNSICPGKGVHISYLLLPLFTESNSLFSSILSVGSQHHAEIFRFHPVTYLPNVLIRPSFPHSPISYLILLPLFFISLSAWFGPFSNINDQWMTSLIPFTRDGTRSEIRLRSQSHRVCNTCGIKHHLLSPLNPVEKWTLVEYSRDCASRNV